MFLSLSLRSENGGTGPEAFPKVTSVPFLFNNLKSLSNLGVKFEALSG